MKNDPVPYAVSTNELLSKRGTLIGCGNPDGRLISGDNCWGQLTFVFEAVETSFSFAVDVARPSERSFSNSLTIEPADSRIDVGFIYENTGKTDLSGIKIGFYDTPSGAAGSLEAENAQVYKNDESSVMAFLDNDHSYIVGTLKAHEKVTLQAVLRINDWSTLCHDGQLSVYGTAISDWFYRADSMASLFPDPAQCQ
jgi:hypothetical protein